MGYFTVLLACGWLLFIPPKSYLEDLKRPLSQWQHVGSFDTAAECEKTRNEMATSLKKTDDKDLFVKYAAARCVPTEALGFKFK